MKTTAELCLVLDELILC